MRRAHRISLYSKHLEDRSVLPLVQSKSPSFIASGSASDVYLAGSSLTSKLYERRLHTWSASKPRAAGNRKARSRAFQRASPALCITRHSSREGRPPAVPPPTELQLFWISVFVAPPTWNSWACAFEMDGGTLGAGAGGGGSCNARLFYRYSHRSPLTSAEPNVFDGIAFWSEVC